jgi:hypothetical protein
LSDARNQFRKLYKKYRESNPKKTELDIF